MKVKLLKKIRKRCDFKWLPTENCWLLLDHKTHTSIRFETTERVVLHFAYEFCGIFTATNWARRKQETKDYIEYINDRKGFG